MRTREQIISQTRIFADDPKGEQLQRILEVLLDIRTLLVRDKPAEEEKR